MNFEEQLKKGNIKKIPKDDLRFRSLFKTSEESLLAIKMIPLNEISSKTIMRELYEALREFVECIGFFHGYKFSNHISMVDFLNDFLKENLISIKFNRYRRIRNDINYYGKNIDIETTKKAMIEIPEMIDKLKKHL